MNSSTSSSSLPSSSSVTSSGFLSDREVKKIEKIIARAAAADEKQVSSALDDVKKAEKALTKSSKASASFSFSSSSAGFSGSIADIVDDFRQPTERRSWSPRRGSASLRPRRSSTRLSASSQARRRRSTRRRTPSRCVSASLPAFPVKLGGG